MEGKNFVELQGKIMWPDLSYTANGTAKYKFKVAIPFTTRDGEEKQSYVRAVAWAQNAEDMSKLGDQAWVKIHGRYSERSFNGSCQHCSGEIKRYWTEVVVDNFLEIGE